MGNCECSIHSQGHRDITGPRSHQCRHWKTSLGAALAYTALSIISPSCLRLMLWPPRVAMHPCDRAKVHIALLSPVVLLNKWSREEYLSTLIPCFSSYTRRHHPFLCHTRGWGSWQQAFETRRKTQRPWYSINIKGSYREEEASPSFLKWIKNPPR